MSAQRSGGVVFAAMVILITGSLNLIWGISALSQDEYFDEGGLLFESLETWGWAYLLLGVVQLGVAALVFADNRIGYALGMFGAFLAILVNFASVGAYPIWSVMLIALNFLVLWALATNA